MWNPFKSVKDFMLHKGLDKGAKAVAEKTPKSWRSSLGGAGAVFAALGAILQPMYDTDPATNPDWTVVSGLLALAFAAFKARDQKAHELGATKDQSKRDSALTGVFILVCLLGLSTPAQAQYSAFLGASLDGSGQRNAAGHLCGVKRTESGLALIPCINMRGSSDGDPVYDLSQDIGYPLISRGGIDVFTLGGAGLTTDANSTAGLLNAGVGVERRKLWKNLGLGGLVKLVWSPGNDTPDDPDRKFVPRISLGVTWDLE